MRRTSIGIAVGPPYGRDADRRSTMIRLGWSTRDRRTEFALTASRSGLAATIATSCPAAVRRAPPHPKGPEGGARPCSPAPHAIGLPVSDLWRHPSQQPHQALHVGQDAKTTNCVGNERQRGQPKRSGCGHIKSGASVHPICQDGGASYKDQEADRAQIRRRTSRRPSGDGRIPSIAVRSECAVPGGPSLPR